MADLQSLIHRYKDLHFSSLWGELLALYEEVDTHTQEFTSSLSIQCPPFCGTCCEHFIPDLSADEASLIASFMVHIKKDLHLISRIDPNYEGTGCPLYDKEDPYHCQIYPVRSLVCRTFGASPSKDKYNEPVFRKCKYNSDETQKSVIGSEEIHEKIENVQTMQDASISLRSLLVSSLNEPLPIAIYHALQHLTLISSYIALDGKDAVDKPDPSSPVAV